jgi:hypothetical protein
MGDGIVRTAINRFGAGATRLWRKKLVEGSGKEGFTITAKGLFDYATQITQQLVK